LGPAWALPQPFVTVWAPVAATSGQRSRSDELESDLVHEHGKPLSAADKPLRTT